MRPTKILVGVDGSASSYAALDYACELATGLGAEIAAIVVRHMPPHVAGYVSDEMMARSEEYYRRILDQARAHCDRCGACLEVVLVDGHPVVAIADYAREKGFDLIVVGSRGLGGLTRWLVGSTAEGVIREAHCPVLVYRGSEGKQR